METIIIPVDLSNQFNNSLFFALMFEQAKPLDIILLFENIKYEKEYLQKFEEIVVNYQPAFVHHESVIRYHITTGKIEEELPTLVEENKESIFINTYHDPDNSEHKCFTKEGILKLIKTSSHNVLALPTEKIPPTIKKIVFPIHHISKVRHKVTLTAKIAKIFGSEVHVLNTQVTNQKNVAKQCTLYSRQVTRHFRNVGVHANLKEVSGTNLTDTILEYAESIQADLISVIPERLKGGVFGKSYIQEMVNATKTPLMVVGPRKMRISESFKTSG